MKTIFSKLIFSFLFVTLVAILSIGVFFTGLLQNNLMKQKETELINKGNQIVEISRSFINGRIDESTFSLLLASIDNIIDSRTFIIDKSQIVLNSPQYDNSHGIMPPGKGTKLDNSDFRQILNGDVLVKSGYNDMFNETMITVGIPVYADKAKTSVSGAIIMNSPVRGITAATNKTIVILIIAGLGALVLCLIAAYYLARSISKPVHIIAAAAIEIADGDYSKKVDIHREDEIGKLAYAFNYLTEKLNYTINALNTEKSKLSDILQSLEEGLVAVDMDLKIIQMNPAALSLLNISKNDSLSLSQALENDSITTIAKQVLATGKSQIKESHISESRIYNFVISPLKYETEEIYGAIILIQDISESFKLEKMRRDFLANVSHELRTPLTSIRGFIEPLTDGTEIDSKTSLKYREIIKAETIRLEKIINDILDLSRLQSGKTVLDIQKIDLVDLIENIIDKFKPLSRDKNISIEFEKPSEPVFVAADGDRLAQVVIIFIDNAIKYTNTDGLIKIKFVLEDDTVHVSISDNGIGIPEEDLPYIWERFYKVDKSRTNKYSGTGLGLSIAKNIIELHNQRVAVQSKKGEGSTFEFTIKKWISE